MGLQEIPDVICLCPVDRTVGVNHDLQIYEIEMILKLFIKEEKILTIRRVLQAEHAEVGASIQVLPLIDPNVPQEARDVEHNLVALASG